MELEKYEPQATVSKLADRPKLTAAELKTTFDEAEKDIAEYLNDKLIPEINKNFEGAKTYIDEKDKAIADALGEHVNYTENPHNVTASQVFLDYDTSVPEGSVAWNLNSLGSIISGVQEALGFHMINYDGDNPHKVTKEQIGLGNVDNTSDIDKPISNAMEEALGEKISFSYVVGDVDDCYIMGNSHLYYVYPLGVGTEEEPHYMLSVTENQPMFVITFPLRENYYSLKVTQYKFVTSDIKMRTGVLNCKEYNGEHTLISKEWHEWESVEMTRNKVAVIDENSTDEQYPSAKAVWDAIKYKQKVVTITSIENNIGTSSHTFEQINEAYSNGERIICVIPDKDADAYGFFFRISEGEYRADIKHYNDYYEVRLFKGAGQRCEVYYSNFISDSLEDDSTNYALSANQGRVLNETKADKEVWEKLVDVTLTENLTDEFRQIFDKSYKKIRFKIKFVGDSTMTLTQLRFKRCKTDGNNSHYNYNYLKYSSSGNLSTARIIAGTVEFDIDNSIVIKNSSITTSASVFGTNGDTYRSDNFYSEEMQTFPEFYMYLGTNVIGAGSIIEVWGCN